MTVQGHYTNTPEMWKQLFERAGLKQEQIVHLGVDQPAVPTGGYYIEITKIVEKENSVEVFARETSPSPGSLVTEAFTQPYHIVKMKKVDKRLYSKDKTQCMILSPQK